MKILFIGDIVGEPGRKAVSTLVPRLRRQHDLDVVIANGENSAGGSGITPKTAVFMHVNDTFGSAMQKGITATLAKFPDTPYKIVETIAYTEGQTVML